MSKILDVKNLTVKVNSGKKELKIIDDISLSLNSGETVGIIGESGCGKSITALSILRLLEKNMRKKGRHGFSRTDDSFKSCV